MALCHVGFLRRALSPSPLIPPPGDDRVSAHRRQFGDRISARNGERRRRPLPISSNRNAGRLRRQNVRRGDHGFKIRILSNLPLKLGIIFVRVSRAMGDRRMSDQSHLKDGIATPVLTVIVALVFVLVLFSKFCGLGRSILRRLGLARGWKRHIDGAIEAFGHHTQPHRRAMFQIAAAVRSKRSPSHQRRFPAI